MPRHFPSHRTLLSSVEAAIATYSRRLRANLLRQREGVNDTDHAGPDDPGEELAWLFGKDSYELGYWSTQDHERREGDLAYALVRLLELRDRLKATEPWPAREEA